MDVDIEMYRHGDDRLWARIGRFFADRKVRQELGGPMSSDERYTWWVAIVRGKIAGFAAVEVIKQAAFFRHAYVLEPYRENGAYTALLAARLRFVRAAELDHVTAYCTPCTRDRLAAAGFREIGQRGRYVTMRLDL